MELFDPLEIACDPAQDFLVPISPRIPREASKLPAPPAARRPSLKNPPKTGDELVKECIERVLDIPADKKGKKKKPGEDPITIRQAKMQKKLHGTLRSIIPLGSTRLPREAGGTAQEDKRKG